MATVEIPLRAIKTTYDMRVTLDGVAYVLRFRWNARSSSLHMDIYNANQVLLVGSLPLYVDIPVTYKYIGRIDGFPPGQFVVVDETGQGRNPDPDNAGVDVRLLYYEAN